MIFYFCSFILFLLELHFYKEALCFIMSMHSLYSNMLTLESIFKYLRQKFKKKTMFILKFCPRMKCFHIFFLLFFIPEWNFILVFLTEMSSFRDEISSGQKRVNSRRHFTIDRDDFIPTRVSSRDEILRVSTLLYSINWPRFIFWLPLLLEILGNMCTRFFI